MAKRAFDVAIATLLLALTAPLFLVLAILVKATSRGPVFHRGVRSGKSGTPFELLKFRSMRTGSAAIGPGITRAGDSRVTPVGRLLRRSKLDELPQLLNVLRGDMSLVGPRPEDPRYVALYTAVQRRVLAVKPGITSAAAIVYRNEEQELARDDWERHYIEVVMPAKLAIDLEWMRQPSLMADVAILGRTLLALFR